MLESSYNPKAVSSANAAGLWQLIPATATRFGLQVSDNEDQRFDSKASTQAALAYLAFLYKKFDKDIALTLAAYNAGEGRVARAIKKAGSRANAMAVKSANPAFPISRQRTLSNMSWRVQKLSLDPNVEV